MYPFEEKCSGLAGFQGIDYNVIIGFHILSSCGGLGNGRVKEKITISTHL